MVVQSFFCLTLCHPKDCRMPGSPVLHHLQDLAQTHVHWVSDAIQSTHPVSPSSLWLQSFPASGSFPMNQFLHQVARVLEVQHKSFLWIFRVDFLQDWLVWSPCSLSYSQVLSNTTVLQSINSSVHSLLYCPTLKSIHDYWKNHSFDYTDLCRQSSVYITEWVMRHIYCMTIISDLVIYLPSTWPKAWNSIVHVSYFWEEPREQPEAY